MLEKKIELKEISLKIKCHPSSLNSYIKRFPDYFIENKGGIDLVKKLTKRKTIHEKMDENKGEIKEMLKSKFCVRDICDHFDWNRTSFSTWLKKNSDIL